MKIFRRAGHFAGHDDQSAAMQQRAENLPHREVEGKGMEQRPHVLFAEFEPVIRSGKQAHQVVVGKQGAFRFAGRARGVDHIGQVVRRGLVERVFRAVTVQSVSQIERLHLFGDGQFVEQRRLGQQQLDTAVMHQKAQAILRIIRIQRHVSAAGLEDGQQADNHLQTALGSQPDAHIRTDALLAQFVRQLVGTLVELPVTQLFATKAQGDSLRVTLGLGFDALMRTVLARVDRKVAVPVTQGVLAFLGTQQGQVSDTLIDVVAHAVKQVAPMAGHTLDGCRVEQVGGVGQCGCQAVRAFAGVEGQVELRGVLVGHLIFQAQPCQLTGLVMALALVVVGHLEQRAAAQVALRLQGFDQLLERQVLMGLRLHGGVFDLLQQLGHGGLRGELGLQHLGVDEEADQPLGFAAGTVGDRHAHAYIGLTAVAMQQGLQRSQQQHEQRDALLPRQPLEAVEQRGVQLDVQARPAVAAQRRTRPISGQFQNRLLLAQLLRPVRQLTFLFTHFQPVALPECIVGVLDRQRRQFDLAPQAGGLIELHQLLDHDRHRPAIGDDVVLGQYQYMLLPAQPEQVDPQQWPLLQIERLLHMTIHPAFNALASGQLLDTERKRRRRLHHLQRFITLLFEGRAQGFVTLGQLLHAAPQCLDIQRAVQAQRQRNVVGRAMRFQLPDDPLPLLRVRERGRCLRLPHGNRCDPVEIHPLTLEQHRQRLAFTGGQRFNGVKQLLHWGLSC